MMVAVLLGALSLGACVDNNESASVEAVRNAKAAQLNGLAAISNAQAEATLIIAKADAAIKEAAAEAQKIANELQGIELEIAKAGLTAKLEAAKAKAEANLLKQQAKLETAKAELIAAMDQVTIAEKARVQKLLAEADLVLNGGRNAVTGAIYVGINANRKSLIDAKFDKAGLEAGLINVKDLQAQTIAGQKRNIAVSEALIAEYGKFGQVSYDEAVKALNEANAKLKGLQEVKTAANIAKDAAEAKVILADYNITNSAYLAAAARDTKSEYVEQVIVEYTYSDGTYGVQTQASYPNTVANLDKINAAVTKSTRDLVPVEAALKAANKTLTDLLASAGYKAVVKAESDAQVAYDADKSDANRVALESAEQAVIAYTTNEEAAVESATTNVEAAKATLKTETDKLAAVTANEATYMALLKVKEEAKKAELEAIIAADKADHDVTVQSTLWRVLDLAVNGDNNPNTPDVVTDFAELIQLEKDEISKANVKIAEAQDVADAEELIAEKDREIASLEQQLKIDEAAYADYMAQIKALIEAAK